AQANGKLFQLTWKDGKAFTYDLNDWKQSGTFKYDGEGWGLAFDGTQLVMSNGSDNLTFRDPATFAIKRQVSVTLEGKPVMQLNELEVVDGEVYANIWQTKQIVRIDPASGNVTGDIDAGPVLAALTDDDLRVPTGVPDAHGIDVLNGIAYDPLAQHFLIT